MLLGYILMWLIFIGIIILILNILYYIIPLVFRELKLIISLYYNLNLKRAILRHIVHFLIFLIPFSMILWIAFINKASVSYMIIFGIFLISSFVGFYIFLFFIYAMFDKNKIKIFISLVLGGAIFIVFAPTGYYSLSPIYKFKTRPYDICHEKEDWLVGGECTSRDLNLDDVVGKWQMLKNRDIKGEYDRYYFTLKSDGSVIFHTYYVVVNQSYYDTIEYLDYNGSWSLELIGKGLTGSIANKRHPYIKIKLDNLEDTIIFRFDSRYGSNLYLANQYDDFDAPHYLTYIHTGNKK